MSCSVNLVPTAQLHARARGRRRTAWASACTIGALLLGGGWTVQYFATRALGRLSGHVRTLEVQRSEMGRQFVTASSERDELLERLQVIAAARRPQPWARHLTQLARETPEGVFLTQMTVTSLSGARPGATGGRRSALARAPTAPTESAGPVGQSVRLLGYALDHASLIQLLDTIKRFPEWDQVELVRATLEPYRAGMVVAFELDCHTAEEQR